MRKSFRFLWQFEWTYWATIVIFAAVVTALTQYSGAGYHENSLSFFQTYYATYALLELLFLFIFSFTMSTVYLHMALSFGARRADYFAALQLYMLSMAAVAWAVQQGMARLPSLLGWPLAVGWEMMLTLGNLPFWVFPLLCMAIQAVGMVCGLLVNRHKVLGIAVVVLASMAGIGGVVAVMLLFEFDARLGLADFQRWFPVAAAAVSAVLLAGCEWGLRRYIKFSCVR
ncbi:MAG: hypothetical protein HFF39_04755 [Lawsonibacter sp.]|nr:hypothetical protein [Lawsonibacter sp.]